MVSFINQYEMLYVVRTLIVHIAKPSLCLHKIMFLISNIMNI
jgi:hypothetical protein